MSSWWLVGLTALLLGVPWVQMPRRRERPEIHGILRLLWWINVFYCWFWHRLEVVRMAPLPEHGPAILVANHTSGIDSTVLQAGCRRVLGFLIAREFYEHKLLNPICRILGCIPVRRDGHDQAAVRAALRALEEGRVVPVFPEGRITPQSGRTIGEGRPGAAFLVHHARVPVIPGYLWGTPATSDVWEGLLTSSRSHVIFGGPVDLSDLEHDGPPSRETLDAITERLMEAIRNLRTEAMARDESGGGVWSQGPTAESTHDGRPSENGAGALSGDRPALHGA